MNRREFIQLGVAAGLGITRPRLLMADVDKVHLGSDVEPLARLIEETPRDRLFSALAERVHAGTGPVALWRAVMLAGVRTIVPRPVGFKFHAVLVVNPALLTSLEVSDDERWLPLFWTVDNFKVSQAKAVSEGGWTMPELAEKDLPSAARARALFIEAMDRWEEKKADTAIAGLYRAAGAADIAELFFRYGARDFRDIGHKAIYVANGWRLLQAIGWRHAEPVLRSLTLALLQRDQDLSVEKPWNENLERARRIRADWPSGTKSVAATGELLVTLRRATWAEAGEAIVNQLNSGVAPESVWDALHLRGMELLVQQPAIFGIHCVTSMNALRFAYEASSVDETRRMLLLQAAAFLVLFRETMKPKGLDETRLIDKIEPAPVADGAAGLDEIFEAIGTDRFAAMRKTLGWLARHDHALEDWERRAREIICDKGDDAHDYKFCAAALEDAYKVSEPWRARYVAGAVFNLTASTAEASDVTRRAREALASRI